MTLSVGTRLGPYEILSPLGAGGMGEVYRARDTRLDRTVAVKVLPAHLAQDPDRRARFEREARAASALNHPHICAVHDVGQQDGIDYLVMEHLEGETLADRLQKGALPQEQALRIGVQVADALDKAHRAGIVHRDLKPGNVMLTKAGAKLLDFGLARVAEPAGIAGGLSTFPTQAKPLTEAGSLLGTFQYMAPEQLEGKEADARTDIFAFGSILYEMLTGRRAFEGKSQASLIAAILEREPAPIATLQPMTPHALERLVRRCLAKDPDERWQSAGDLAAELKWIADGGSVGAPPTASARRLPASLVLATGCLLLGGLAGGLLVRRPARPPATEVFPQRFSVNLPHGMALSTGPDGGGVMALSPDGHYLAFTGYTAGSSQIYLRALGDVEAKPVPHTQGATNPFFSPDGQWLGFTAERKLRKISIRGGQPVTIYDAPDSRGASWGDDGTILFVPSLFTGMSRVGADGTGPRVVTKPDPTTTPGGERWPQMLPGGKAALVSPVRSWRDEGRDIAVVSLATGQSTVVVKGASYPRYVDGILFYARGGSILASAFDVGRLAVVGPEVTVLDDVRMSPRVTGSAFFEVASNGVAVFVPGFLRAVERTLVWFDRAGRMRPIGSTPRPYQAPVLSPDGRRIAVSVEGPGSDDIWIGDLASDAWTRLMFEGDNRGPVWSPDGLRVAFQSLREGAPSLYWAPADGSGKPTRLPLERPGYVTPRAFSPDGKEMLVTAIFPDATGMDLWIVGTAEGNRPRPIVATPATEGAGAFSPDGRWLSYSSDDSGRSEIYVQPYPDGGRRWLVSRGGGSGARWLRSGREIVYRNGNQMMSVAVKTANGFEAAAPRVLFEVPSAIVGVSVWGDVTADGERFLMVKGPEDPGPQIVVAPGFLDEVRARLRAASAGHE